MSAAAPAPRGLAYSPELEGVRGLAILMVLVWHYFVHQAVVLPGTTLYWIARSGLLTWSGVDLFFVLSGFLLGSTLIAQRGAPGYYLAFYARRTCRILPLYALLLLAYVAASLWLHERGNPGHAWLFGRPMPFWTYATFTQNFAMGMANTSGAHFLGITWSLAVEEQFYLALPLLIAWTPKRALPWLLAALIAAAPLLRIVAQARGLDAFVLTPTRMDSLLAGVLLAHLLSEPATRGWFERRRRFLKWLLVIFALGVVILSIDRTTLGVLDHTWLAAFFTLLIALVQLERGGAIARILRARWLTGLGVISYSVYLFHQAISGLMHSALLRRQPLMDSHASIAVTLAALALTIGLALATRRLIEAPVIALGRKVAYADRR